MIDDYAGTDRWQVRAACRTMDPELFFPERGETQAEAKAVCATCPVRRDCLKYAIDNCERHGIWGGLSERERRKIRRVSPRKPQEPWNKGETFSRFGERPNGERQARYRAKVAERMRQGEGKTA